MKLLKTLDDLITFARKFPVLKKFPVRFYKFVVVGLSVFVLDFTLFRILFDVFQLRLRVLDIISIANVLSVATATVFGYLANKHWSFENKSRNIASQFGRYVVVAILNNILNNIIFGFLFYNVFGPLSLSLFVSSSLAKILATSFQVVTSYLAYKFIVFRE